MYFTSKDKKRIETQIKQIVSKANAEVQLITEIDKYEELFGKIKLDYKQCIDTKQSIIHRFETRNWNRMDESMPKWSYKVLYDRAVNNAHQHYTKQPEEMCASVFASKTARLLEKLMKD